MVRSVAVAAALLIGACCSGSTNAQVFKPWTYSQYSPTGNAYVHGPYGSFPVYPLGAWRNVGYDPYYDPYLDDVYYSRPYRRSPWRRHYVSPYWR